MPVAIASLARGDVGQVMHVFLDVYASSLVLCHSRVIRTCCPTKYGIVEISLPRQTFLNTLFKE